MEHIKKIFKKLTAVLLVVLYVITFSTCRGLFAYNAQSANYKLLSGSLVDGASSEKSSSYKISNVSLGEICSGSAKSSVYLITNSFAAMITDNPPVFNGPILNQSWPKNSIFSNAIDLNNYFSSEKELTYACYGSSNIIIEINTDNHLVSFSQPQDYYGAETIYFIATDKDRNTVRSNNIILQVLNINNPPVIDPIDNITANEGDIITITPHATDTDLDEITFSYSKPFVPVDSLGTTAKWHTDFHDGDGGSRTYIVRITATDKDGSTWRDINVKVLNINRCPVIQPIADIIGKEGGAVSVTPIISDEDGDEISFFYSSLFSKNGTWLPTYDQAGNYPITISATDGIDTVTENFNVIIENTNRPPLLSAVVSSYTLEPGEYCDLVISASDPDNDVIRYTILKDGIKLDSGNITDTYIISLSFVEIGDHTIEVIITDNGLPQSLSTSIIRCINIINPNADRDAISPIMGDFNGDSITDIGFHDVNNGSWEISVSEGSGFTNTTLWLNNFGVSKDWIPIGGDFNGDGYTDIGIYNNTTGEDGGKCEIALSTGESLTFESSGIWSVFENSSYEWQPITGDFNIDSRTDLALYNKKTGEIKVAFSDSTGFGEFNSWIKDFGVEDQKILSGDFNGDSLIDVCTFNKNNGTWQVCLNNTKAFVDISNWIENFAKGQDNILVSDFNNDGLADVGYWEKSTGCWYYAVSKGDAFIEQGIWYENFGTDSDEYAFTGDFNGDGITNPALFNKNNNGILKWNTNLTAGNFAKDPVKPDLLVQVDNGTGGITRIGYDYASNYSNELLPFPVYVVKTITTTDTLPLDSENELYGQYISYKGGYYDAVEKEFRGFAEVEVKDPITKNYTITTFYQGKPGENNALKGKIKKIVAYDGNSRKISEILNIWNVRKSGPSENVMVFPYLEKIETTVWEENGISLTTLTEFQYDNLGNLIKTINNGDTTKSNDTKIVEASYSSAYENGYNRPIETILLDGNNTIITKKNFEYDSRGNLLKETAYLDTAPENSPCTVFSYDSFGNLILKQNPNYSIIRTTYETDYYTFPETIVNQLGHTIIYNYNPAFGIVEEQTDANNYKTISVYDTYGRIIEQLNPDQETVITYAYPDFNTKVTSQINMETTEYVDGLGRVYKKIFSGERDELISDIAKETVFNNRGFVDYETLPHYADEVPISFIKYTYDLRGRITSVTSDYEGTSFDSTLYKHYNSPLEIETINAKGQKKVTINDVYGNNVKVIEYNGLDGVYETEYKYNVRGDLIEVVDAQNNHTYIYYDSLGRKTAMDDPDMGRWSYEYDKMGNLIKQTDAKNQTITFEYDVINRLTKKMGPVPLSGAVPIFTVIYTYDQNINGIGRLSSTTDTNRYTTIYSYDKEGRVTTSSITINENTYISTTDYDLIGRTKSVTYPDGETVNYIYDTNSGHLESVVGNTSYIQNITYNAMSQIKNILYGNNTTTQYVYRNDHKLQKMRTTLSDGITHIQDFNYEFDKTGNILRLVDNFNNNIRDFEYDSLNRLTKAVNVPDPVGNYSTINYQYDSIGNMIYKDGLGFMSYGGNSVGPHAVTTAGGYNYDYDANGNQISGRGRYMEYDIENNIIKVTTPSETIDFEYNANGNRIRKISDSETVTYISSSYEIRESSEEEKILKHIFTGSDRSITVETLTGTNVVPRTYYHHNDHLGSTSVITDEFENVVQRCEYTPFGQVASNTGTYNNPYKFTGKELDDKTELYYYNSRYYDPVLCHFIQPDTIIPNVLDPQAFNRYSYCRNNPIIYTDPSGHSWWNKICDWWEGLCDDISDAIDDGIEWLEKITGCEWDVDVEYEYTVPIGQGGEGSPSSPSGGGGDSTGYTETYYDYDPYYDPIIHPQPQAVSNRGYAPVPQYHILGITSEELGNYWLLMNLDPIQAALESGDFGKAIDNSGFEAKQLVADTIFNRASKIQKANYIGPNNVNINLDVISVIAGVVSYAPTPITTIGGYIISAAASGVNWNYTEHQYKQGKATKCDLIITRITTIISFTPRIGIIGSGAQLIYDIIRYNNGS